MVAQGRDEFRAAFGIGGLEKLLRMLRFDNRSQRDAGPRRDRFAPS